MGLSKAIGDLGDGHFDARLRLGKLPSIYNCLLALSSPIFGVVDDDELDPEKYGPITGLPDLARNQPSMVDSCAFPPPSSHYDHDHEHSPPLSPPPPIIAASAAATTAVADDHDDHENHDHDDPDHDRRHRHYHHRFTTLQRHDRYTNDYRNRRRRRGVRLGTATATRCG
ncbi:hypothetical protein D9613_004311 [Agrocybe pediades]|uniref:Uncharacterized protein n=1 Tax=Agrocybe pediades TaxID=84607 RepID=A0A8H4QII4_9AGAR|nr:hypothetical protein D9613_004311 [Agrocybe pediades]